MLTSLSTQQLESSGLDVQAGVGSSVQRCRSQAEQSGLARYRPISDDPVGTRATKLKPSLVRVVESGPRGMDRDSRSLSLVSFSVGVVVVREGRAREDRGRCRERDGRDVVLVWDKRALVVADGWRGSITIVANFALAAGEGDSQVEGGALGYRSAVGRVR